MPRADRAAATALSSSAATRGRRISPTRTPAVRRLGHYFNVITNGFGAMPDHAAQVKVRDRWAIAAYLRALQASASASINDIPPAERARLEASQ